MKKTNKVLLMSLLTFRSVFAFAQDEEPCKLILQNGLYKTYQMAKTGNFQQDLKTYFSSEQFKRDFKDSKWGGFLSVVVDDVPLGLGVNSSDVQMNEFQSKIRQSTSLTTSQSFYDYAYTNIPDVELAKQYSDCLIGTRKFGFKVNPSISDKEVLFIVSYYKEVDADPMPKVVRFEIRGANNITKSFNIGDVLKNQTSITCDRDPDKDLTLVLETDRGVASLKVAAQPTGFNKDLPVGTIITSYLNWTEFQAITKNNTNNPAGNLWSAKFSKWAPADGREASNSGFQRIANQTKLPDLRGMFIRGLNQFDQDQPTIVDANKKDPDTRTRGSYQEDKFKSHNHGGGNHSHTIYGETGAAGGRGSFITGDRRSSTQWDGNPGVDNSGDIIKSEGETETRPKNIAIYYYIRIN